MRRETQYTINKKKQALLTRNLRLNGTVIASKNFQLIKLRKILCFWIYWCPHLLVKTLEKPKWDKGAYLVVCRPSKQNMRVDCTLYIRMEQAHYCRFWGQGKNIDCFGDAEPLQFSAPLKRVPFKTSKKIFTKLLKQFYIIF